MFGSGATVKLLIVEDNEEIAELIGHAATQSGFDVVITYDIPEARRALEREKLDLLILDLNLGEWNGLDLLREIRRESLIPIIVLTARGGEDDKVQAFELGADDYVTKPFSPRELIARIGARLRHIDQPGILAPLMVARIHGIGPLSVNVNERSIRKNGEPIKLTVMEFRLLLALIDHQSSAVESRTLLREVWGYDDPAGLDVVRVTMHRLRHKLEDDPSAPQLIHTVPGVGFMLKVVSAA